MFDNSISFICYAFDSFTHYAHLFMLHLQRQGNPLVDVTDTRYPPQDSPRMANMRHHLFKNLNYTSHFLWQSPPHKQDLLQVLPHIPWHSSIGWHIYFTIFRRRLCETLQNSNLITLSTFRQTPKLLLSLGKMLTTSWLFPPAVTWCSWCEGVRKLVILFLSNLRIYELFFLLPKYGRSCFWRTD